VIDPDQPLRLGTAGWSIPSRHAGEFARSGSHLQRYAGRMNCVEIDSSFSKPHKRETYQRWAAAVPDDFRFSVKMPRTVTHECRLAGCHDPVARFLAEAGGLGDKLAALLVQLPPSLAFERGLAEPFFRLLRHESAARIVCEPRDASWSSAEADALFVTLGVARVAAHPARFEGADAPAGTADLAYYRLHGAPRVYYSDYPHDELVELRRTLDRQAGAGAEVWCIFDNTAAGHALGNALAVGAMECADG
jgi:uncharacterized protein YecE (DUF72 family)